MLVKHWYILFYFFVTPLFLLVSVALIVTNAISACLFHFRVGRINPGIYGMALISRCSWHSRSSMLVSCSVSDSMSTTQSSSLWFGLSKSPIKWSQSSVSEMLWVTLSSPILTRWRLILRIQQTFNIWDRPPERSFADKAGGEGDLSDNVSAAAPLWWKSDHDALPMSSVSEMYPMAVICFCWTQDSFWVACRFWLPCHISKTLWTLVVLCNFLSSTSFFISEPLSVFIVSNSVSARAIIPAVAWATALQSLLCEGSRLRSLTASSQ